MADKEQVRCEVQMEDTERKTREGMHLRQVEENQD